MRDRFNELKRVWRSRVSVVRVDTCAVAVASCVVASESCDEREEIWGHGGAWRKVGVDIIKRPCKPGRYNQSSPARRVSRQLFVNGARAAVRDEHVLGAQRSGRDRVTDRVVT